MIFVAAYILLVVAVNIAFAIVPLLPLPGGDMFPPVSLLVGLVFVARDFAQRAVGHRVIWAMMVATGASYVLADAQPHRACVRFPLCPR